MSKAAVPDHLPPIVHPGDPALPGAGERAEIHHPVLKCPVKGAARKRTIDAGSGDVAAVVHCHSHIGTKCMAGDCACPASAVKAVVRSSARTNGFVNVARRCAGAPDRVLRVTMMDRLPPRRHERVVERFHRDPAKLEPHAAIARRRTTSPFCDFSVTPLKIAWTRRVQSVYPLSIASIRSVGQSDSRRRLNDSSRKATGCVHNRCTQGGSMTRRSTSSSNDALPRLAVFLI
jgi:hypothetical protein